MSVVDLLAEVAPGRDRSRVVLATPRETWTLAELQEAVDARATALGREGVTSGSVHPIVLEPDADGVLTLLALWRRGATPVPLNPKLTRGERERAVAQLAGVEGGAQVIVWTSGTSGRPRGVGLDFEGLRAHGEASARRLDLDGSEVWLSSLALAHVGGLALVTRSLFTGATLLAGGAFEARTTSSWIDGRGLPPQVGAVTHASLVPTQLLRLLEHRRGTPPPSSFRCALVGGAHAPAELVARALSRGWPVALTYCMTEMTSQVATAPPCVVRAKPGTVGRPLDGVDLRISEGGEILVRGPTRAAWIGLDSGPLADAEGWYHTGDLGRLDEEGDLWVTGRRADRIVSGGYTVDAVEVEEALRAHPAVVDACVIGIPSTEWGETVAALVVPVWGEFDVTEIEPWVAARLTGAKRPRVWRIEHELPRNANGKVDRVAVRALFGRG